MNQPNGHYAYYPGCSLHATAHAYDTSTRQVANILGMPLIEVEDWNCCGATEYFSIDMLPAYSLVARNLALAAKQGSELVAPCSMCYLNLRKTDTNMTKHEKLNAQVNRALKAGNLSYKPGSVRVRHILDAIVEDVGYDAIEAKVNKPLYGLRVAPYYGCLVTRPYGEYNAEYPTHLDDLFKTLGADIIDFPMKTHCCGGHMTQISEDTAYEMIRRILRNAEEYQADAIVAVCPMCQLNLDAYQPQVNRMFGTNYQIPVLFFTQLMGTAFGVPESELGFETLIVSPRAALDKISEEAPQPRKPARRDKQALPMPPR